MSAIYIQALSSIRVSLAKIIADIDKTLATPVQPPTPIANLDLYNEIIKSFSSLNSTIKDKNIISAFTMTPLKWTRNTNCWASGLDLTGMSVGIWGLGGVGGGSLITPKHVLLANHVPYPALPATIYFTDKNNNSYEYKIVKTKRVATSDILIGELDREIDSSLKIYKVLPSNFAKYLPIQPMSGEPRFPVTYSDQEKKMLMGDYISTFNTGTEKVMVINPPADSNSLKYFEEVIVGDSGNPVSTIINNELVLLGGWYQTRGPNGGWATPIHAYLTEINEVISSFGSTYKLIECNLSSFKQY